MSAATSRAASPQAWLQPAGLILAFLGFVVGAFSYTGPRIYDVKYFFVALGGFFLILGGVIVAGWGRIVTSRPRRARRTPKAAAAKPEAEAAEAPSVPARKRGLAALLKRTKSKEPASPFGGWRKPQDAENGEDQAPAEAAVPEKAETDAASEPEAPAAAPAKAEPEAEPAPAAESPPVEAAEEAPAPSVPAPPESDLPVTERLTVECPRCQTAFTIEGTRPIPMRCPSCHLSGTIR